MHNSNPREDVEKLWKSWSNHPKWVGKFFLEAGMTLAQSDELDADVCNFAVAYANQRDSSKSASPSPETKPEYCCPECAEESGKVWPDDYVSDSCYECGGRGWKIVCIDDLCHGEDECIHGDPPAPCRNCNPKGDKDDNY